MRRPDQPTLALCVLAAGFGSGVAILVAAAIWYVVQDPTPLSLAIVGVAAIVIGTFAAVLMMPPPGLPKPPPTPDPFKEPRHD